MKEKFKSLKNIILITSILMYSYLLFKGRNQYIFSMDYARCITFVLLLCILIYIYGVIENKNKTYKNNINIYFFLYFLLLISVTFFIGRPDIKFYDWWYAGQYEPFHTITSQFQYGTKSSIIKNLIGNSIMLIPLSLLLMIKNDKYKNILKQTVIILPIIIIIELLQSFTHTGSFDIDDIILNYLGTIMFTFLITKLSVIDKIKKLFYKTYKIKDSVKYAIFSLISVVLIIYIIIIFLKLNL